MLRTLPSLFSSVLSSFPLYSCSPVLHILISPLISPLFLIASTSTWLYFVLYIWGRNKGQEDDRRERQRKTDRENKQAESLFLFDFLFHHPAALVRWSPCRAAQPTVLLLGTPAYKSEAFMHICLVWLWLLCKIFIARPSILLSVWEKTGTQWKNECAGSHGSLGPWMRWCRWVLVPDQQQNKAVYLCSGSVSYQQCMWDPNP